MRTNCLRLVAFVRRRLADGDDEVARPLRRRRRHPLGANVVCRHRRVGDDLLDVLLAEFRQQHVHQRKRRVRPRVNRHVELPDHGIPEIGVRRLLRALQQLLAIDDLDDAVAAGAVAEVDAIGFRPSRDRPVQLRRHRIHCRAGLLPGQAEITDEDRMRRIAQVVDLRHARRAPRGIAADEIRDAGVALPPALVRVLQPADDSRDLRRLFRRRHVPDLMACGAKRPEEERLVPVGLREPAAGTHHLRLAGASNT